MSKTCPACGAPLLEQEIGEVHVDICRDCRGVWFDDGELEGYRRHVGHDGRPSSVLMTYEESGPRRSCPQCGEPTLAERSVAGRPVLHCARCFGLFLTEEELKALIPSKDDYGWVNLADAAEVLEIPLRILEAVAEVLSCFDF